MTNPRLARLALLLTSAFLLGGCNTPEGPPVPSGILAVSGDAQYANAGSPAANPMVVLVTDQNGAALANAPVIWKVTGGGGAVADSTSSTDASGHAKMSYTAGSTPGSATIVATAALVWTATFTIYIEAP